MRQSVRFGMGNIFMPSNELFQRLILTVFISGPTEDPIFTYESMPIASVMFYDDGTIRKNTKPLLITISSKLGN